MFVDPAGSTAMSARLDPADTARRPCHQDACSVVRATTALLVHGRRHPLRYFGFPRAHGARGARRAVLGLELVEVVAGLKTPAPEESVCRCRHRPRLGHMITRARAGTGRRRRHPQSRGPRSARLWPAGGIVSIPGHAAASSVTSSAARTASTPPQASTGSARPLTACLPISRSRNWSPTSRRVAWI